MKRLALRAGAAYFGLVFGAGFLFGMVRVTLLVPRLGDRWAELAEMPLMFVVVVLAARHVVRRFGLPSGAGLRLATGAIALTMALGAELLLAVLLEGRSLPDYLASRDPVSGAVYLLMLGVYAVMPCMLGIRDRARHTGS